MWDFEGGQAPPNNTFGFLSWADFSKFLLLHINFISGSFMRIFRNSLLFLNEKFFRHSSYPFTVALVMLAQAGWMGS